MSILHKNPSVHKYEHYIYEYLSAQGDVTLEKLGSFQLSKEKVVPDSSEFDAPYLIHFTYDRKAVTSERLIEFIAEKEKKLKLLVAFDLESYLEEVRQFINLGKSFPIEGLGSLTMNKLHEIDFLQETKLETKEGAEHSKRKRIDGYLNFDKKLKQTVEGSKISLPVIILLFIIFLSVSGTIYFWIYKKDNLSSLHLSKPEPAASESLVDTSIKKNIQPTSDLLTKNNSDSFLVNFVFEVTTNKFRAYSRIAKLREFGDPAFLDSIRNDTGYMYKLYVRQMILEADSSKAKDSVQIYFQKPIRIEVVK